MTTRRPLPALPAAVLAVVTGFVGVLAFPRFGIWPLAVVSVAGLAAVTHGQRPRRALWLGYLYGWAFFGPLLSWTGTFVGAVWLLLPFAEAAFVAVLAAVSPTLQRRRGAIVWLACLWVGQEALRDRGPFGGFPWGRLAFSQSTSPLRWFAALGGAPLVTFVVALAGAALWRFGEGVATRSWRGPALRPAALALVVLIAMPLVGFGVGAAAGPPDTPRRTATIALVQGDVPDRGLEFNARRRQVLDNHVQRTLQLAADIRAKKVAKPELVVWPENASDIDPFDNADARAEITRAVAAVGVPILVGAVLDGPGPTHVSNVGILWTPAGPGQRYVKRHPVPFGEYLPLRPLALKISSKAALVARDMIAGKGNGLVRGGPFPIGDVICFEVAYDGLVRSSVHAGAQLLVVQTNNATFGHSAETYQQLAMSRLRAVETGRTVVQVATSGKSAIIAPDGTVTAESGALFTPAVIVRPVALSSSITLGVRAGVWPELVLSVAALAAVVAGAVLDRRRPARPRRPDKELVRA